MYEYPDAAAGDVFEREPAAVVFQSVSDPSVSFSIVVVHMKPDDAVAVRSERERVVMSEREGEGGGRRTRLVVFLVLLCVCVCVWDVCSVLETGNFRDVCGI